MVEIIAFEIAKIVVLTVTFEGLFADMFIRTVVYDNAQDNVDSCV